MNLRAIFEKPVDRKIEGVIKADDESGLRLEVEEYVLTDEVAKRLEAFLDVYNNYAGANGVWISGFFGSGKSHLLKMLALMLENREVEGAPILDLFLPKCGDNEILRGDLKRAVAIPSRSILFNIDQKADVISKTQIDALVAVFVKVFDEMCGYYGKHGHVAQFERDLDSRGLYDDFKAAYGSLAGRAWETGREQTLLEARNIAKAYAAATGEPESAAEKILDKYRLQYHISIEDFAEQVKAYIDRQGPKFRLNFFVDEVGQYIADNVKLMTNLQTIAESLATKCQGRAWIIVTAQEDMNTVVGEGRQQSNDFSKIQARFANRMKLTSADVAEVIQKRLLLKNESGIRLLTDLYHAQANNFKTLFDFADGAQSYRNYRDRDHFIHSYPFIPYQFVLFQSAIQNLSNHNAFEGKHSSVGERSMLGVFQQVAIRIGDHQPGQLATFDLMFEGIRTALKSNTQRAIQVAEKNLDDAFAVRLLKTLLLVKYVKEFKPTVRNLCVLMLDGFDQDLPALRTQVENALALLEQQTYIQRTGELYEYLTDEEKDVEQEIKNTEVETVDVANELEKIVFDHVVRQRKIRYDENGQDYAYARKLDDRLHGREYELAIHVISPFHEHVENLPTLQMQNMGRDELLVVMPPDERLVRDLLMFKRSEKYIRQNISITQQEAIRRILSDKGTQNDQRLKDIQSRTHLLLGRATLFAGGSEIEIGGEDGQTRIIRGFHALIERSYPNLRMLQGVRYSENEIGHYLRQSQEGLFGTDVLALAEPEQEVLAFIQNNKRGGVRTTLSRLIERFEHKPYGWYYAAILCTVAKLCARGKVEVRSDGNLLEGEALEAALRNSRIHANVLLEPQVEFTQSQVRTLKEFFEDFFDRPPQASEARALGKETDEAFQALYYELAPLAVQREQFPFLTALAPMLEQLQRCSKQPYSWYLTELPQQEDSLLDLKEQVFGPIQKFMRGPQGAIYEEARTFLQEQDANFSYVDSEQSEQIQAILADPHCYRNGAMQRVKPLVDALQSQVTQQIQIERDQARESVISLQNGIAAMADFGALAPDQQSQIMATFDRFLSFLEQQRLIALIRDRLRTFEERDYQQLLTQIASWVQPTSATELGITYPNGDKKQQGDKKIVETPGAYTLRQAIPIDFAKPCLADEKDLDDYLAALRKALLAEIQLGKRIQL